MKHYEKPMLTALSLNGNEQLCGYCADQNYVTVADLTADQIWAIETFAGFTPDGKLTRDEFNGLFASSADTCTNLIDLDSYCKFSSATSGAIQIAFS